MNRPFLSDTGNRPMKFVLPALAVTAAFAAIRGHIREDHYVAAVKALADEPDAQPAG